MKEEKINDITYKLPSGLNAFQKNLYVHLINWKWKHISKDPGTNKYKNRQISYDAILPEMKNNDYPLIYPAILEDFKAHKNKTNFKLHKHFNHMASSQIANINLFLPILLHEKVDEVLKHIKPDFNKLATERLDKGFSVEFWNENCNDKKGLLGDHSPGAGTDVDLAIAYYNTENELCLWLIEHKLAEKEFTKCGGYKSKGRDSSTHFCNETFDSILKNKQFCYYHDRNKYNYWKLTEAFQSFYLNANGYKSCPFMKGMNQLWRNQLLGFALEKSGSYKHVYFSVVKHPDNNSLDKTINEYKTLVNDNLSFFVFTSKDVVDATRIIDNSTLNDWVDWFCDLYNIK